MMKTTLDSLGFAINDGYIHVYNVDPLTSEFIGESDEYLTFGVGLPADSCLDEPLVAKEGFAVIRIDGAWSYTEDHRNKIAYSIETGQKIAITELGPLSDGITIHSPNTPFDKWNGSTWVTDNLALKQDAVDKAKADKYKLESLAKDMIEKLTDAIEFDMALDGDDLKLKEWRKYRVLLNQIDVTMAPEINWPTQP